MFTRSDSRERFDRVETGSSVASRQLIAADMWDACLSDDLKLDSEEYKAEVEADRYAGAEASLIGAMDRYKLDAIVMPFSLTWRSCSLSRCPAITVPLGAYGLDVPYKPSSDLPYAAETLFNGPNQPFGLCFVARRFDDFNLLSIAHAFEQATLARNKIKPIVCPTVQLADTMG